MYQKLMCTDGEEAYSSKIIFPRLHPGLEQSLEQILGPVSVNPAGSELALIHFFSQHLKTLVKV